jgi:membrane-associated protease RseP (regulator of RpoE activity)
MLGSEFRVHPLFWVSCALLGVRYYHDPEGVGVGMFIFWMAAAFMCLLLHELGHVAAARLFGGRPRVFLGGLGGRTLGAEWLSRWRRVVVLLAGPLVTFLIVGVLFAFTAMTFPAWIKERGWGDAVANGWYVLTWCNFCWGVLNLLPLWPLDGGQIACATAEGLAGRRGVSLALLVSVAVAGALTLWDLWAMRTHLTNRYDPRYPLYLEYFSILLVYCFAFWVSSFKALWGGPVPPPDTSA